MKIQMTEPISRASDSVNLRRCQDFAYLSLYLSVLTAMVQGCALRITEIFPTQESYSLRKFQKDEF